MDAMELNKTIAAVLIAGIVFFLTGLIGDNLVRMRPLKEAAIKIEMPTSAPAGGAPAPAPASPPIAVLLAKADAAAGEAATKQVGCVACHSFNEGGKNGLGPNLYGIVGEPIGQGKDYSFSKALSSKTGNWTFALLNEWLTKPAAFAPGTKMTFAGVKDDQQRANIIAYLRTLSHNPEPLPTPTEAELHPAAAAVPAAGGAPAEPSIETLLASADPARGEADTKRLGCVACHSFNQGGKNGIGPNLYGVVGEPIAQGKDYNFSEALKKHTGPWTFAELNKWLTKPAAYAPGTRMTFMGVPKAEDRADIIDYLRTLSATPEPLPAAK